MNDAQYDNTNQTEMEAFVGDPTEQSIVCPPANASAEAPETVVEEVAASAEAIAANPCVPEDPCADPDPDPGSLDAKEQATLLDELRGELNALKNDLNAARERAARTEREYAEFCELYPNVSIEACNDRVWRAVEAGVPLAAAYALEERRNAMRRETASVSNAQNRDRSVGRIRDNQQDFFTPDEVRAMNAQDVRSNLSKIMLSMKKWGKY